MSNASPSDASWLTSAPRCPCSGPLAKIYFGSQFAPLIIFFVMFLSIVKNTKLHHFVRFNCMQVGNVYRVCGCTVSPFAESSYACAGVAVHAAGRLCCGSAVAGQIVLPMTVCDHDLHCKHGGIVWC